MELSQTVNKKDADRLLKVMVTESEMLARICRDMTSIGAAERVRTLIDRHRD